MQTPSLIDDWFGVTYSRPALTALLHGDYVASGVDFAGRFRPGYTAIWNYAQWHIPTGPSIVTAAAWGMLRVALFLVAVWMLTRWLAGKGSRVAPLLVWLAPLAVVLTPAIAVDLARYGPGEPMMIAGLIIGLGLIATGVRKLLAGSHGQERALAFAAIAAGYVLYLIGVYSKEASVCLLVFVPFLLKAVPPLRSYAPPASKARSLLVILAALVLAPLVHLAAHLGLAILAGDRPYPNVDLSLRTKIFAAGISPFFGEPGVLGTWLWTAAVPTAIAVAVTTARRREREAWLLFGALLTGFCMSAVALARGPTPSWYYIPWVVALAAVAFRGLSRAKVITQIAVAVLIVGLAASSTPSAIADWARTERRGSTAVELAKTVVTAGCPLYLANFDIEQRVAIPQLFRFVHGKPVATCTRDASEAYALSWQAKPLPLDFAARCASDWQPLAPRNGVSLLRCPSFRQAKIPDQVAASGLPHVTVVRLRLTRVPSPLNLFQPRALD